MKVIRYTPGDFDRVERASRRMIPGVGLSHRPFVDHYYAGSDHAELLLAVDDAGEVAGTFGVERMPFLAGDRPLTLGFGSNFHALRKGVGGILYLHFLRSCPVGLIYGGTEEAHALYRRQKWTYYDGLTLLELNRPLTPYDSDPAWRRAAKVALQRVRPRVDLTRLADRLRDGPAAGLEVREEFAYPDDPRPARSPFTLRFAPDRAYLEWRYGLDLPFVRYRLFRILDNQDNRAIGYVILNDAPGRLAVAHSDGEDAERLALGTLLALGAAAAGGDRRRGAILACCHPAMRAAYVSAGFKVADPSHSLALKAGTPGVELPGPDTTGWLVDLDWGDNLLQAPFPVRKSVGPAPMAGVRS